MVTASAVAWSTAGLFTRALDTDLATTLVWRGLFGGAGILVFAMIEEGWDAFARFKKLHFAGWMFAIISAAGMLCFIASLKVTTVAHVSIIYGVVPFVAASLGWLFVGETPSRSALLASSAALLGVAIMVGLSTEGNMWGNILAFMMTLAVAGMMVIARKWQDIPMLQAACLSALVSAVAVFPFATPLSPVGIEWLTLAAFGLVNSAIGLALFSIGSKFIPTIETALIGALDAPLAPLWVWLVFGERPSIATLLGGGIVFAAVIGHMLTNRSNAGAV